MTTRQSILTYSLLRMLSVALVGALLTVLSPLKAQAYCQSGDVSGPNIYNITLRDPQSLASYPDDVVSGRVRSDIIASDPSGMHVVNWYLDNVFIRSYTYSLHQTDSYLTFNSSRLGSGAHTISVEIIDSCGYSSRFDKPFTVGN